MINHREQIKTELAETRKGLVELCQDISDEDFVWEPRPGMKSVKAQLEECGIMDKLHAHLVTTGEMLDWKTAITWSGENVEAYLKDLAAIRKETNQVIDNISDDAWFSPIAIPEEWKQWWGKEKAPESLIRWILRHEYYHVGQIVTNRWLLGHNPYGEA
jgi:uncharacterized damage-inducible protein DinB